MSRMTDEILIMMIDTESMQSKDCSERDMFCDTFLGTFPNGSRVLIRLTRCIHTAATVKTFIIRLQGLVGVSKSSLHVGSGMSRSSLHVSHLDVCTDTVVDTFIIRSQGLFLSREID